MSLSDLRIEWTQRYGPAPKHRAPDLLRRILAWRIQAEAFGGLDAVTIRLLSTQRAPMKIAQSPGTRLEREYAGKRHEVVLAENGEGIVYEDTHYDSLSEVARVITGQRRNGSRFFGLRWGDAI